MNYIDAHCHLLDENEIQLARTTGIENIICNATNPNDWEKVLALKNVIHAIGIHPWYVGDLNENAIGNLENLLIQNPNCHIGEIGLDKCKKDFYKQEEVFEAQLKLAQRLNRPVHIHCVRAWQEVLAIIKNYPNLTYLFHGFSGDKNVIRFLEKFNAYFSVSHGAKIPLIPANKLLIESDAPDGLPSPANLPFLYMQLGIDSEQINQNFKDFLNGR
jgi:TatD DNase family protein